MKRLLALALLAAANAQAVLAVDYSLMHDEQLARASDDWRQEIEADQQAADVAFARLDRAIALITDASGVGETMTLLELKRVVGLLRKLAPEVVVAHEEAADKTRRLGESLRKAAPIFAESASRFRAYSREESYDDLQEDYALWAKFFDALSVRYKQQSLATEPAAQTLSWNLHYVRRTGVMLKRIDEHLTVPTLAEADTERFLRRLAVYVRGFSDLRRRLRVLQARIVETDVDPQSATDPSGSPVTALDGPAVDAVLPNRPAATASASKVYGFYVGRWMIVTPHGRTTVTIHPVGGQLSIELAEPENRPDSIRGELRIEPAGARLVGLAYQPRGGDWVEVGDYRLDLESADVLAFYCPIVSGSFKEGFAVTDRFARHELRRLKY